MKIFATATPPNQPRSRDSQKAAYMYAAILVIFAVGQLFAFDEFLTLFEGFGVIGGQFVARLMGSLMVICEVFALPFLLGMRLSKLARITSMIMSWLVPFGWLKIALWLNLTSNCATNIGFVGTKIELLPGWWAVFFVVALGALSAWASWGLWPFSKQHNLKK